MSETFGNRVLGRGSKWILGPAAAGAARPADATPRTVDVAVARVLELLAFSVPLYIVGFPIAGYDFSLPTLLLILLAGLLVYRGEFVRRRFLAAALFVGWALFTAVGRHSPVTYFPSLAALVLVITPLCSSLPRTLEPDRLLRWLLAGFVLSLAFAGWELGVNFIGLPPLEDLISVGLLAEVRTQEMLGFRRVKSSMAEPADYAIYLVAIFALVDLATRRGFRIPAAIWVKGAAVLALLPTLSLSGFLLLGVYVAVRWGGQARGFLSHLDVHRSMLPRALVGLGLVAALVLLGRWLVVRIDPAIFDLVFGRLERVMFVLQNAVYRGSEGSRANAIPVMLDYWSSQGLDGLLVGEGYARYQGWLESTFAHWESSTLAQGRLANVLAILGISTGAVGLLLYLAFVASVAADPARRLPAAFVAVWLVMHLAYGFLIGYLLWSLLLAAQVVLGRPADSPEARPGWRPGLLVVDTGADGATRRGAEQGGGRAGGRGVEGG